MIVLQGAEYYNKWNKFSSTTKQLLHKDSILAHLVVQPLPKLCYMLTLNFNE